MAQWPNWIIYVFLAARKWPAQGPLMCVCSVSYITKCLSFPMSLTFQLETLWNLRLKLLGSSQNFRKSSAYVKFGLLSYLKMFRQVHVQRMKTCMLLFVFCLICCHFEAFPDWKLKKMEFITVNGFDMMKLFYFMRFFPF